MDQDVPRRATHLIVIKATNTGNVTVTIEKLLINGVVICHLDSATGAWKEAGEPSPKKSLLKVPEGGCVPPTTLVLQP